MTAIARCLKDRLRVGTGFRNGRELSGKKAIAELVPLIDAQISRGNDRNPTIETCHQVIAQVACIVAGAIDEGGLSPA